VKVKRNALVQISRDGQRRVAQVDGEDLRLLDARWTDIYSLAMQAVDSASAWFRR
jgi:hypothetical protein